MRFLMLLIFIVPIFSSSANEVEKKVEKMLQTEFAYRPGYTKKIKYRSDRSKYLKLKIELTSNFKDPIFKKPLIVNFYLHLNKVARKGDIASRPLVIFLPPVLGITPADHLLGKYFAREGIHSVLFDFGENLVARSNEPEDINAGLRRGIIRFQMMFDYLEKEHKGQIQFDKVGTYGMSMGGVAGGFVMGLMRKKVKYAMIVVGGGDMPDIIAHSNQGLVRSLRKGMISRESKRKGKTLTIPEFEAYLRENLVYDPTQFADHSLWNRVYFIEGGSDTGVPFRNQVKLRQAFGQNAPRLLYEGAEHFPTVYRMLTNPGEILRFFKYSFKVGSTAGFKHSLLREAKFSP